MSNRSFGFSHHVPAPKPLRQWIIIFIFIIYLILCAWVLFAVVIPRMNGETEIRVGADSDTYYEIADGIRSYGAEGVAFVSVNGNLLGPVLLAFILKSGVAVAFLDFCLFVSAVYASGRIGRVNQGVFLLLLMLNAETFASLITLNKEIFALFSAVLFALYIDNEKRLKGVLLLALSAALMARWQQLAIEVLFLIFQGKRFVLLRRPKTALAMLIFAITIAYPVAFRVIDLSSLTIQGETGGTITTLNKMQANFLFPFALAPKILINFAGQLATPRYFFGEYWTYSFTDWQNQFVIQLHTLSMVIICSIAFVRGRIRFDQPLVFFCALYAVITALTPFVQPRYQYPIYVLLCLELAREPQFQPTGLKFAFKLVPLFTFQFSKAKEAGRVERSSLLIT